MVCSKVFRNVKDKSVYAIEFGNSAGTGLWSRLDATRIAAAAKQQMTALPSQCVTVSDYHTKQGQVGFAITSSSAKECKTCGGGKCFCSL